MDLATAATLVYDGTYIFPFDLSCLDMNEEINNAVIDFYVKYLFRQWLNNEQRQRVQVLESVYLENISKTVSRNGFFIVLRPKNIRIWAAFNTFWTSIKSSVTS